MECTLAYAVRVGLHEAATNLKRHGVSFEEAMEAFTDPNAVEIYDREHSDSEPGINLIGYSHRRLLFVVFTQREAEETVTNIVSARKAGQEHWKLYEQND